MTHTSFLPRPFCVRACLSPNQRFVSSRVSSSCHGAPIALRERSQRSRGARVSLQVRGEGDSYKMYVPPDAFGGETPERKASKAIRAMHTYVAAHIVAGQLMNLAPRINTFNGTQGGSGVDGEAEGGRVAMGYDLIMAFLEKNPVRDGDEWLKKLAAEAPSIASRIATVRLAYCSQDFEWDTLKKVCVEETQNANAEVMRSWATAMFGKEGDGGASSSAGGKAAGGDQ